MLLQREIIIRVKQIHDDLDEKGRQSCDLTSVVQGRFGTPGNIVKHTLHRSRESFSLHGTGTIFPIKLVSGVVVQAFCHTCPRVRK